MERHAITIQDAIKEWEDFWNWANDDPPDHEKAVVEAARKYANPAWWVELEGGGRVAGPFTTAMDANRARGWIEKVTEPEIFWIRNSSGLGYRFDSEDTAQPNVCSECKGTGAGEEQTPWKTNPCHVCDGSGEATE